MNYNFAIASRKAVESYLCAPYDVVAASWHQWTTCMIDGVAVLIRMEPLVSSLRIPHWANLNILFLFFWS